MTTTSIARPKLYAHRGSTVLAPENSLPAFDLALEFGADVLETDVRLSRDGRLVVFHDATVQRTTDGRGRVRGHRVAELTALDAGARHRGPTGDPWRGAPARVITLDELLERYPQVALNIDIKDPHREAAEATAATLARHGRREGITVGSFHAPTLARFRAAAPDIPTAATRAEVLALYTGRSRPHRRALPCAALQIPARYALIDLSTPRFLRAVRAQSLELVYWTINDAATMMRLAATGADGLVTDRIDIASALWPDRSR